LVVSTDDEIEKIISALHETYNVAHVAPGHCTGEPTFTALKKTFGERYLYAGLGTTFSIGTTPHQIAGHAQHLAIATDEVDLTRYRLLPAESGDHEHGVLSHQAH
jgi:7,8-dihydropterin-6-yl-methyl-4-(beta-D-ribofuranosyl)aminobenzene 5'-phosphate synthase